MKRVLSLVLALVLVLGMIPTFAAEKTGAELLFDNEFIAGDGMGNLMEDQLLTREQLAKLILELNGSIAEAEALTLPPSYTDSAKISPWARPYVAYAQIEGLMIGFNDGSFRPQEGVSAQQLAAVLTRALGYEFAWATVIADAADLGIEVANATKLTRGEAFEAMWTTVNTNVKDSENTLGAILGKLGPIIPAKVEIASAAMAGTKKLDVTFNKAVDTTKAVVKVKKGAAIYSGTVTWNDAKTVASVATLIALPAGDYVVEVTGLDEVLTKTVTVIAEAAGKIEVTSTTLDDATAAAKVNFVVKNQYGEDMGVLASNVVVSAYNVTQNANVALTSGAVKYFTIDTQTTADAFKTGDSVRVIVSYAGLTAQGNLTVQQPAKAATLSFGELVLAKDDVRLNVADATVKLSYVLLDQYGQPKKLTANAANAGAILANDGVNLITSNAIVTGFSTNADGELVVAFNASGTALVTGVVNSTGSVSTTQIVINANGKPSTAVIAAPTMLVASQDKAFDLAMTITDQYGDVVKSVADISIEKVDNGQIDNEAVVSKSADSNGVTKLTVDLTGLADATVNATKTFVINVKNTADDKVIGTVSVVIEPEAEVSYIDSVSFGPKFEVGASKALAAADIKAYDQYGRTISAVGFTVADKAGDADLFSSANGATTFVAGNTAGTQRFTVTLDGKTKDISLTVVASADIKTYGIDTIAPIYKGVANTDYNVDVTLVGKTEAGDVVILASDVPQIVTSSNPAVILVDGTAVRGQTVGTATISAWLGGKVVASQDVTVTDAAPVPTSLTITATGADGVQVGTLVTTKDQYGVVIANTGTYLVNGTVRAANYALAGGSTYTVQYVAVNGLTKTVDVVVAP